MKTFLSGFRLTALKAHYPELEKGERNPYTEIGNPYVKDIEIKIEDEVEHVKEILEFLQQQGNDVSEMR
ncbi:hypothetical protein ACFSCZ_11570 [Siminovitchia sediminis]|uniref:Uncharacterized protein n=1 Tax=Siminovitchia sediminis TaxID=1274353 RepID=A0ABW4KMC5_9BACI